MAAADWAQHPPLNRRDERERHCHAEGEHDADVCRGDLGTAGDVFGHPEDPVRSQVERHGQRDTDGRDREEHHRHRRPQERQNEPRSQACVERLVPPGHAQQTVQHEPSRASEQADDEALVQDAAPDGERNEAADGVPHWRAADPLVEWAAPAAFPLRRSRLKHHLIKPVIEQEVTGNGNDEDENSRDRGFGRQRSMPALSDQPALEPDEPRGRGPWKPPHVRRECLRRGWQPRDERQ